MKFSYGSVDRNGKEDWGENFDSEREGRGKYKLTFKNGFFNL